MAMLAYWRVAIILNITMDGISTIFSNLHMDPNNFGEKSDMGFHSTKTTVTRIRSFFKMLEKGTLINPSRFTAMMTLPQCSTHIIRQVPQKRETYVQMRRWTRWFTMTWRYRYDYFPAKIATFYKKTKTLRRSKIIQSYAYMGNHTYLFDT